VIKKMQTIWKYILEPKKTNNIQLPISAEILSVQNQNEKICIWVKLETDALKINRMFAVLGTGWEVESDYDLWFIGTVQLNHGILVFHVFEMCMKE
jgi:hypothetical protein